MKAMAEAVDTEGHITDSFPPATDFKKDSTNFLNANFSAASSWSFCRNSTWLFAQMIFVSHFALSRSSLA